MCVTLLLLMLLWPLLLMPLLVLLPMWLLVLPLLLSVWVLLLPLLHGTKAPFTPHPGSYLLSSSLNRPCVACSGHLKRMVSPHFAVEMLGSCNPSVGTSHSTSCTLAQPATPYDRATRQHPGPALKALLCMG
jgi:hypothetical protein